MTATFSRVVQPHKGFNFRGSTLDRPPQKPCWLAFLLRRAEQGRLKYRRVASKKQAVWKLLAPTPFCFDNLFVVQRHLRYRLEGASRVILDGLGAHDFTFDILE